MFEQRIELCSIFYIFGGFFGPIIFVQVEHSFHSTKFTFSGRKKKTNFSSCYVRSSFLFGKMRNAFHAKTGAQRLMKSHRKGEISSDSHPPVSLHSSCAGPQRTQESDLLMAAVSSFHFVSCFRRMRITACPTHTQQSSSLSKTLTVK